MKFVQCLFTRIEVLIGLYHLISMIVMLNLQVLDEIHRQPVSLSLSMVSLPAPESVVDSFPLKNHKKEKRVEGSDDVEQ